MHTHYTTEMEKVKPQCMGRLFMFSDVRLLRPSYSRILGTGLLQEYVGISGSGSPRLWNHGWVVFTGQTVLSKKGAMPSRSVYLSGNMVDDRSCDACFHNSVPGWQNHGRADSPGHLQDHIERRAYQGE
jgi:hypothetical protein